MHGERDGDGERGGDCGMTDGETDGRSDGGIGERGNSGDGDSSDRVSDAIWREIGYAVLAAVVEEEGFGRTFSRWCSASHFWMW